MPVLLMVEYSAFVNEPDKISVVPELVRVPRFSISPPSFVISPELIAEAV